MDEDIPRIEPGTELDLHHFNPRDARNLIKDFIDDAHAAGAGTVRIVHGKGRSVLKSIVIAELSKNTLVLSFDDDRSNWGATIVHLVPEGGK
jgi:DNA-nicking Smr family endonuclease